MCCSAGLPSTKNWPAEWPRNIMVTTLRLRELFDYREDGALIRRVAASRSSKVGEEVGCLNPNGYKYASVDNKTYMVHVLVWIWHGREITTDLDHENQIGDDNRIDNLRPATHAQNMWNRRRPINNTTGAKGVTWHKEKRKFRVRIGVNGRRMHIGDFDDFELAELVALEARNKYHGQFANHK